MDITGLTETVYEQIQLVKKTKQKLQIETLIAKKTLNNLIQELNPSYVVSVNLLNQLDILLIDYLIQYFDYSDQELKEFRNYIQKNHINSLPISKSCLITDHTEKSYTLENSFLKKTNLLFTDLPYSATKNEWEWGFDMNGYYKKDTKTIFEVIAIRV